MSATTPRATALTSVTSPRRAPGAIPAPGLPRLKTLITLFKLRVVVLLLAAALGGAMLGSNGAPSGPALLWLMVSGTLSAAGASAINQYLERELDRCMARTRQRPLPAGQIDQPVWVLAMGSGMVLLAIALAAVFNPALAFFTGLGAVIYVVVYTLWLKPRTVLNIVIGGAAGSCAVLSGGAAAGDWAESGVLALALLIFVWTPVHFWSLALAYRADYAQAGFPMLPVHTSPRRAAAWIGVHSLLTGLVGLLLAAHPALRLPYLIPVSLATLGLVHLAARLLRRPEGGVALTLFKFSNAYLGIVLVTLIFVSALHPRL